MHNEIAGKRAIGCWCSKILHNHFELLAVNEYRKKKLSACVDVNARNDWPGPLAAFACDHKCVCVCCGLSMSHICPYLWLVSRLYASFSTRMLILNYKPHEHRHFHFSSINKNNKKYVWRFFLFHIIVLCLFIPDSPQYVRIWVLYFGLYSTQYGYVKIRADPCAAFQYFHGHCWKMLMNLSSQWTCAHGRWISCVCTAWSGVTFLWFWLLLWYDSAQNALFLV